MKKINFVGVVMTIMGILLFGLHLAYPETAGQHGPLVVFTASLFIGAGAGFVIASLLRK